MSEMVPLGALNDEGVDALRSHIKRMSEESDLKPVSEICSDSSLVEPVSGDCVVDAAAHFGTKLEFAVYLRDVLSPVDERDLKTRAGLWTWLACVYLHMLCDRRPDGSWSTREMARYIMDSDFQRYYRHGVAGPWMILESAKGDTELAQLMLYGLSTTRMTSSDSWPRGRRFSGTLRFSTPPDCSTGMRRRGGPSVARRQEGRSRLGRCVASPIFCNS